MLFRSEKKNAGKPEEKAVVSRKEQRRNDAQERQRIAALSRPIKKELEKVEKKLEKLSAEKKTLDAKLADTDFYQGNQDEVAVCLKKHGELSAEIDELEAKWLDLSEQLQDIS